MSQTVVTPRGIRRRISSLAAVLATLVAVFGLQVVAAPMAQAVTAFSSVYSANIEGDIVLVANANMTCPTGCTTANSAAMVMVDVDGAAASALQGGGTVTTFNSSTANLAIPAGSTVTFAGLFWSGNTLAGTGGVNAPTVADTNKIMFKTPAMTGYTQITATSTDVDTNSSVAFPVYHSYANVTAQVQAVTGNGNGTYAGANIQSGTGTSGLGDWAGWTLAVAYSNPTEKLRHLVIYNGFERVFGATAASSADVLFTGFVTPVSGVVKAKVGVVAQDGDPGILNDNVTLVSGAAACSSATTAPPRILNTSNPQDNVFNSSITNLNANVTTRNPADAITWGYDADIIQADGYLTAGSTTGCLRLGTTGDTYYVDAVTIAIELPQPILALTKTGVDLNGGNLNPGDVIEYTMSIANNGDDAATNVTLTDPMPTGTTYVPGTLSIGVGPNAGAKTDALADADVANFTGTTAKYFLGTGATNAAGGSLAVGAITTAILRVTVNPGTGGTSIVNTATEMYNGANIPTKTVAASSPGLTVVQPVGTVSGQVYSDTNGNATQAVGEPNLSGLTVTLTDSLGAVRTTTTDASGNYSFANVPIGSASVNVTDPVNNALTTANDPQNVTVTSGGSVSATPVGFQPQGTVTGHVYRDSNGDALQSGGEANLSGLTVTLTDAFGGIRTTTTDASGNYSFAGVPVGVASVNVTNPANNGVTTANDPQNVTIAVGASVATTPVGFQPRGTVTGHVFSDVNNNATQGAGEPDIAGLTVTLTDVNGVIRTTTTDATGNYTFSGVAVGTASVNVTDPAGTVLTTANDPQNVAVTLGGSVAATPVGFQQRGSVTGHVYSDANGNALQGVGDINLSGLTVTLTDSFGAVRTTTTDANGDYAFSGVPVGVASVNVTDPVGNVVTTSNDPQNVTIATGTTATATPVGFQPRGTVTGHVFSDANANAAQGSGDVDLSGLTVTLTDPFDVTRTTTTDSTGNYSFTGVPAGTSSVNVTDPANNALTTANDPQNAVVTAGGTTATPPVGFQPQGSVTGHVYTDTNGNGTQVAGEANLSGLTVTLTDAFGGVRTTTTDANGDYTFGGIPVGVASVNVSDPIGNVVTTANDPQNVTVAVGVSTATTPVGFQQRGTVTGHVFSDANGNALQGAGDIDLSGLTVTLTDPFGVTRTTNTDASGNYSFTGVPAGTSSVNVTDPAGNVLITANDPQNVAVTAGASTAATPVGFQPQGSFAGHVYLDANGNGTQAGGETNLSGLTVTLTDPFGVTRTTTTDANGNYSFANVPAGTSSVNVSDPSGYVLTTANDPQNVAVSVGVLTTATPVGFQPLGTITGHVFSDPNGNGTQTAGEANLSGLTVTLTDPFGVTRTTTTDSSGNYTFTAVPAGTSSVNVTDPAGNALTTANDPQNAVVTAGGTTATTAVGFQPQGSVTGHVYSDINGNATQTAGEPNLSGLTVTLTDSLGVTRTTLTDSSGNYTFGGIPVGSASVNVTDPAGTVLTTSNDPQNVTVAVNTTVVATPVGFQPQGTVTGHVFSDLNGNALQGAGDVDLSGLTVTLTDPFGVVRTTTTDASGNYTFSGVPGGTSSVDVTDPVGNVLTTGNDPQNVAVTAGATTAATPVGFQAPGIITGHVFSDANGNAAQGSGDVDLSGLTVTMTDAFGTVRTTATDASGNYSFTGVRVGVASVNVSDPAGTVLTTGNDPQNVTVAAGASVGATPVGFQPQGSITGHVFSDANGNATQAAGEADLSGLTVTLTDALGVVRTTTTDASGNYTFAGVPVGTSSVNVTDPAGNVVTTSNDPQNVTVTVGATTAATPVGFQPQGTITGHVFSDADNNGTQDGTDIDFTGRTVTLTDAFGVTRTTTTDTNGNYTFTAVPAGSATVNVTDPSGYTLTTANDPQTLSVLAGATATATPVGFYPQGAVTGHVFNDANGNGIQEAGEADLVGVTITLTPSTGAPRTMVTDANGNYTFTAVPAGTATVNVTDPAGNVLTTANDPQTVTVSTTATATATPVGFQPLGMVTGHVFSDANGNAAKGSGDVDLSGLTVTLTDPFGVTRTTTTDASGDYSFTGVPAGTSSVNVTDPANNVLTTSNDPQNVVVVAGGSTAATPVGFQPQGTVTGHVFSDANGNAVQGSGDADLSGLTVSLTDAFGGVRTTTTDANGNYTFTGVAVGTVSVNVTDPAGSVLTTANDPQSVAVVAGVSTAATPVGFQPQGSVTGHVFSDLDGNGTQDAGEVDLSGLTVTLTDAFGVTHTTLTDASGNYTFGGMPVGSASVNVTDPAGNVLTTANDTQNVMVVAGVSAAAAPVGFQPQGTVTGHVFSDPDGNGTQAAGEADLSGLTVTLTDSLGVVRTTTTDASGNYTFSGVPVGTSSVNVTDPAGNVLTTSNDPQNVAVTVGASTAATPVGFQPQGTITGHVFSDANGDAAQGSGDVDLSGLTVTLTDSFGVTRTTSTDSSGNYSFTGVPAGSASVNVTDPAGNVLTTSNDPQNVSVVAGVSAVATPVGFQPQGSVTGHVFSDANGNGTQAAGEVDLSGLTVTLTDAFGVVRTTTTDASGNYSFTGVLAGAASVNVTDPAGNVLTTANDPQNVTVVAGVSAAAAPVGFQPQGTITGHVFSDANGNGTQASGETDLSGITVTLTDTLGVTRTTTTDASGNYSFVGVPVGTSSVNVTDPAGNVLTTSNDAQDVVVTVGTATAATPVGFQPQGSITGHVFSDANGNGTQAAGETDLSGLTVTLTDSLGVTRNTTTDANGNYTFTGVPVGTSSVNVTDPANNVLTTSNDAQDVVVTVGAATAATPVGFQPQGTITGHVFSDADNNGTQDGTDIDFSGRTVTLTDVYGAVRTTTTDANGNYTFTGVPVGAAVVNVADPAGYILTTSNDPQTVTVAEGTTATATPVGFHPQGGVAGHVFSDLNGNGIQDGTEPDLVGVTVTLTPSSGAPLTATTDANGNYSFVSVPAGTATVNVTDPAGNVLTTANDPQTLSVNTTTAASATPVGFQPQGTITGHVFSDANGSGTQIAGEADLSGITVTLTDAFGVIRTTTTDANGNYTFTGVPVGTASVNVTDPANTALTTANDAQTVTVATGVSTAATPVGFQEQGSISGHVYSDVNGNGTQAAGEANLSGLTVTLTDVYGVVHTTLTDANGDYTFGGIPVGSATLNVTDPAGNVLTTSNDPQTVTIAAGTTAPTTPVGFQPQGTITGHVFNDVSGNGTQTAGDANLSGLTVTLTDALGVVHTAVTDANGDYSFTGLPVGTSSVTVSGPAGNIITTANDPQDVVVATGVATAATPVGFQALGAVAGHVFSDLNADGTQNAAESNLAGITVTLTDSLGVVHTAVTDALGNYSFTDIPVGPSTITMTSPAGSVVTTANVPQTVVVSTTATATATPVGFQAQGGITGQVFADVNGNGTQAAGEANLSGLTITATDAYGVATTTTTDVNGSYSFTGLGAGVVTVVVTGPSGSVVTTSNNPQDVTVVAATSVATTPVGFQAQGSVTGHVFTDINSDALQNGTETNFGGVIVTLTDSQGVTHSTTTDSAGNYSFTGIPVGDASVTATTPAGHIVTTANDPQSVTVAAGSATAATPIGFNPQGGVSGHVFADVNGNGVQDASEPNLAGVIVTLTPETGAPITATTDANGNYNFPSVTAGVATINVTDPANTMLTTANDPQTITVTTGGALIAAPVGFQPQGSVSGHLFSDVDGNGTQAAGEANLSGLTVTLTDVYGVVHTTLTDANGDYTFGGIPTGDAIITVTDPAGTVLTTGNDPQTVTISQGTTASATPVGFQPQGTVTGFVFADSNGNAVQNAGETNLAGITVTMTDSLGVIHTTTTDATGAYTFAGIPVGTATVNVTDPAGYVLTTSNDSQTVAVATGVNTDATPVGFQPQAPVTGHVFADVNGNGIQDAGEPDLAGVVVTLTPSTGAPRTVTTDAIGNYTFTAVPAGTSTVNVSDPAGNMLTTANDPQTVTVTSTSPVTATPVGFQQQGTITGNVFSDANGNGTQATGEANLAGITVTLTDPFGVISTTVTDANGNYTFTNVAVGTSTVNVTNPLNSALTTANDPQAVIVASNAVTTSAPVGFQSLGSVDGHVFTDVDGNGTQGTSDTNLSGLTVSLTDVNGVVHTTLTDANGNYSFSAIPVGLATINVTDPTGTALTTGNDPQTVTISTGISAVATPVGYQPQGSIGGHLFTDANGDGTQGAGEANLAGVTVTFTDALGVVHTTITDANGNYTFTALPVGSGTVNVTDPAGNVVTTANDPQTVIVITGATVNATAVGFQAQGIVSGHVFTDTNGDGIQNGTETNLAGVIVTLTDAFGVTYSTMTDSAGNYSFTAIPAGTATIDITDPAGNIVTTANDPQTVTVTGGTTAVATPVGFQPQGGLSGHVFTDTNGNGVQDVGEPNLAGVNVTLNPAVGGSVTVTTDANGNYNFTGVPAGVATINVSDPANTVATTANDPQTVTVTADGAGMATPVGFQAQGIVSGQVFIDANGNATQGTGEANLAGVTVTLTDPFGVTRTTTTDANGNYTFTGVPVGVSSVDVAGPVGAVSTTGNDPQTVTVNPGTTAVPTHVGFLTLGSLSGQVFSDVNGNGTQGAGEANLAGITVTLTDALGTVHTTLTDANGMYTFGSIPVGAATVNVTDPIGSTVTTANDPQTVTIANGTPATATPVGYQWTGTVTGSIFTDTNGDGIVAGTETNLAGVTVTLTDANGTVFTAITDSTGTYTFTGVPVGAATIVVGTPANTILTTGNAPQSITVSTTPVTPSAIGFQPGGSVSGQLFSDVDGNGVKDATEPTLAGVTVTLTDVYGVVHTTLTDANGMYTFGSVAVGVSTVSVATPAGTVLTTANDPQTVTIVAGVPAAATTIGFQPLGVVSGSVFGDANGNGLINAGETNLSGLTVTLVDALGVTHTTVTDVNGNYTFTGIPVGTATVDVTDPANATLTTANDAQTITVVQGVAATTTPVGFSVNVAPVYTAAATNTAQTVGLGAALTSVGATDANTDPLVYTLTSGTLPAGVTLNADGTFTGTPSTAGTFVVMISVADGRGGVATTTLTIEVPAATTTTTSSTSTTSTTSTTTTIVVPDSTTTTTVVVPDSTTTTTVVVPDSTTTTTVVVPDSSTTTTVVVPDSTTSTTPTTSTPPTSTVVGITSTTGVPPTTGVPSVTTTTVADPATSTTTTMVPEVTTTTLVAPTTTLVAPSTTVPPVVTTFVFPTIPEATIPTTTPTTTPETTTTTVAPLVFEPVLPVETPATSTQPTTSIQPTTAVPNTTRTPTDIPGVGNATVSSSAPIVVEEAPANTPGTPSSDPLASVQSSEPVLEIGASATGVTSAKPAAQPTVTTVPTVLAVPTVPKAPKIQVTDDAQTVLSGKSVSIDVLANDEVDATLVFVSKPAHGRAVLVQGRVVYISDDGFDGEDGFDYWITLPTGQKLKGRVVLQVKGNSFTRDLALTGSNSLSLTGSALALLALGLILLLATKRRNDEAAETLR